MEELNNFTKLHDGDNVTGCPLFPDETWKCTTIMIFHRVTACLSLIGCIFVLFTMWLFRRHRVFQQRMILYISVCGGGGAVANIMGESPDLGFCKIIAFINTFFDWGMLLWVIAVASRLCLAIFRRSKAGRFEWAYHCVIWPVSLTVSLLPFFYDMYGNSGVWCWIVHDVSWRMGVWYGPMFCVTIGLSILYIGIVMKIRSMLNIWRETLTPEVDKKSLKGEVLPLLFYPLVYIILYIIPIVNRIHNAMYPKDPEFELVVLAAISATSLGAANSLIYGLDKETLGKLTLREIKNAWLSRFPPKAKAGEYSTESKTGDSQTEAKKAYSDTMSSGASQTEVKLQYSMEIYSVSAQCDGSTASDKMPSRRQASNLP